MQYVNLGRSGLKVSRLCLGCGTYGTKSEQRPWQIDLNDGAYDHLEHAAAKGINFFDTADVYSEGSSEQILGNFIALRRRDDFVIASKCYQKLSDDPNDVGLSRKHIITACENSLRRLQTDYIDLYQIHRFDDQTPIEETISALDHLVQSGKVRYLGASSMTAWRFAKMLFTQHRMLKERFVSMQLYYNMLYREEGREMIPLCQDQGIGITAWSPLARGFLAGKVVRGKGNPVSDAIGKDSSLRARSDVRSLFIDQDYEIVRKLADVNDLSMYKDMSLAKISLSWLLHRSFKPIPVIGVTSIPQMDDLISALQVPYLSAFKELDGAYTAREVKAYEV